MFHRLVQDAWYALNMSRGIGDTILVTCGVVWLRMLLPVLEDVLWPRRERRHRCVHPLPKSWDLAISAPPEPPAEGATALPADSQDNPGKRVA